MESVAARREPVGVAQELLRNQNRLVQRQVANEKAALALRVLLGAAGVAVAALLGLMLWNAAHADGVIIRAFSVSPQLAAQGVSGEVLAAEFLDHINVQQMAAVGTATKRSTIAGAVGEDLRIEIPQTGVSVTDLDRALRAWLGHERVISGAITQVGEAATLTVRLVGQPPVTVSGPASERAAMVRAASEQIFARADPTRAVFYLREQNRRAEVDVLLARIRTFGTPMERADGFAFSAADTSDPVMARTYARQGVDIDPTYPMSFGELANANYALGRWEEARSDNLMYARWLQRAKTVDFGPGGRERLLLVARAREAALAGNFPRSFAATEAASVKLLAERATNPEADLASYAAQAHDINRADLLLQRARLRGADSLALRLARARVDAAAGRWAAADAEFAAEMSGEGADPRAARQRLRLLSDAAVARAMTGDSAGARALLATTPLDCYPCLRARGRVAALIGQATEADRWFGQAVRQGPSLPFAYAEWAEAKLARGEAEGALELLKAAQKRGPRWADASNAEGDALFRIGRFKDAVRRYEAAAERAPRWGALHLAWGKALARSGRARDAEATWRAAAGMHLTAAERAQVQALLARRIT